MTACVIKTLSVQIIIHHWIKPRRGFLISVCNFLLLCVNVCFRVGIFKKTEKVKEKESRFYDRIKVGVRGWESEWGLMVEKND